MTRSGAGVAEELDPAVLVVMDTQRIYREAVALKALQQMIDEQRSTYQEELRRKENELREADKELADQRERLSAVVFAERRKELEEAIMAAQRELQSRKRELDKHFSQGIRQLRSVLVEIAQEIAQERNADLVIEKGAVVLVKPELEITQEALERLNERLPKIDLLTTEDRGGPW
jgi:Skp family chaperone for outer membrane proteins